MTSSFVLSVPIIIVKTTKGNRIKWQVRLLHGFSVKTGAEWKLKWLNSIQSIF